jgi:Leucine-rich repeat (LRR) protein
LDRFTQLKSLVADNNDIEDVSHLPKLSNLETLWLNNNRIHDIDQLLSVCETNFPNLNYLSILKNPACPNEFTGNDTDDYQRHRHVIYIDFY